MSHDRLSPQASLAVSPLATATMWLRDFCGTMTSRAQTVVDFATGDPRLNSERGCAAVAAFASDDLLFGDETHVALNDGFEVVQKPFLSARPRGFIEAA